MRSSERTLRLLLGLVAAWICLSVCAGYVATANFRVTDHERLRNVEEVFAAIPAGEARRQALRYVAGEPNRSIFWTYNTLQVALALAALFLLWLGRPARRMEWILLGVSMLVAASSLFYFTPALETLGRSIDFLPRDPAPESVKTFYRIHGANIVLEMAKLGLLLWVFVLLVRRKVVAD